jgi:hypothetical protein
MKASTGEGATKGGGEAGVNALVVNDDNHPGEKNSADQSLV